MGKNINEVANKVNEANKVEPTKAFIEAFSGSFRN